MSTYAVPTEQHIAAQIDALLEREPDLSVVALRSPQRAMWPEAIQRNGRNYRLSWADSALAARQALRGRRQGEGLVLLTSLSATELGDDILARLSRGRVFEVESWRMLRDIFQARHIDPRLRDQRWVADLLMEYRPVSGYPPVPGGVLDADTAWKHLLDRTVGLSDPRPDAVTLLRWTITEGSLYRLAKLPPEAHGQVIDRLTKVSGPGGRLVMQAVRAGNGSRAVALGLVCGVLFADGAAERPALQAAVTRMESNLGGFEPDWRGGRLWADAAAMVVADAAPDVARIWFDEADHLLESLKARDHVTLSPVLPTAFEARLRDAAKVLTETLAGKLVPADQERLERAADHAFAHRQARLQAARADRLRMAVRLVRWLSREAADQDDDFVAEARLYAHDGGFVDRARLALKGGDDDALLSGAYLELLSRVKQRREVANERFARSLKAWNGAPQQEAANLIPGEAVLDRFVAPLAEKAPILLLVMDGLSFPVFRELADDLEQNGWRSLKPGETPAPLAAVAALPTVTQVARASLLCGRLTTGQANVEQQGFKGHTALLKASKAGIPPILYHKGDLNDDGNSLSNEVRQALADRRQRVVGLVYNAVDDHLSGSDQLILRWGLETLRLLRPILHEARSAGRVLIVTSDHGHVIDDGTQSLGSEGSGRCRPPGGEVSCTELLFSGGRVQASPSNEIVMPWSETVRYGGKKNGYHGGASPQEVLVPLAAFSAVAPPAGWEYGVPADPEWWTTAVTTALRDDAPPKEEAKPPKPRRRPKQSADQGMLFDDDPTPPASSSKRHVPTDEWIDALLESDVYAAQMALAGPARPADKQVRALLTALAERGRMARPALARQVGLPGFQMPGFLAQASRLLNVDQSPILTHDADTVDLDVGLLREQFELKG